MAIDALNPAVSDGRIVLVPRPEGELPTNHDVPPALLEIARLALGRGFDDVSLAFSHLDSSFLAPIAWQLNLTRREVGSFHHLLDAEPEYHGQLYNHPLVRAEHVMISTQRAETGHEEITAFREMTEDKKFIYWDEAQIREWITTPTEMVPAVTAEEEAVNLRHWDEIKEAYLNGWCVRVETRRSDELNLVEFIQERAAEDGTGDTRTREDFGPFTQKIQLSASNSFYNCRSHPWYRNNKDIEERNTLSAEVWYSDGAFYTKSTERCLPHLGAIEYTDKRQLHGTEAREFYERAVRCSAPWFESVAGWLPEEYPSDGWSLPPLTAAWKAAGKKKKKTQ